MGDEMKGTGQQRRRPQRASSEGKPREDAPPAEETPAEQQPLAGAEGIVPEAAPRPDEPAEAAPDEAEAEGGAQLPPPPPMPTDTPEAESQDSPGNQPYDKATLIARADRLLGADPAVAAGVLREAEDPITIDAAKARIDAFLTGAVVNTDEEATR